MTCSMCQNGTTSQWQCICDEIHCRHMAVCDRCKTRRYTAEATLNMDLAVNAKPEDNGPNTLGFRQDGVHEWAVLAGAFNLGAITYSERFGARFYPRETNIGLQRHRMGLIWEAMEDIETTPNLGHFRLTTSVMGTLRETGSHCL